MLSANSRITQRHHWDSVWWEWVFNLRGLLYYSRDAGNTYTNAIYLLGNPAVIWLVAACVALCALLIGLTSRCRRFSTDASALAPYFAALDRWGPAITTMTYCVCAYAANLLPYLAVARSCFIYHYSESSAALRCGGMTADDCTGIVSCTLRPLVLPSSFLLCSARAHVWRARHCASPGYARRETLDAARLRRRDGARRRSLCLLRALDLPFPSHKRGACAATMAAQVGLKLSHSQCQVHWQRSLRGLASLSSESSASTCASPSAAIASARCCGQSPLKFELHRYHCRGTPYCRRASLPLCVDQPPCSMGRLGAVSGHHDESAAWLASLPSPSRHRD